MHFFHNSHVTDAVLRLQRTNSCERLAFASGACRGGRSRPMIFSLRVVRLLLIRRCRPVGWKASRSRICNLASVSSSSSEAHSAEHEVKSPSEGGSTSFSSSASMFTNGARAQARSASRATNLGGIDGCICMSHAQEKTRNCTFSYADKVTIDGGSKKLSRTPSLRPGTTDSFCPGGRSASVSSWRIPNRCL